jgi:hypothetical protein
MIRAFAAAAVFAVAVGSSALADEGMWTFDAFPSAAVAARYGVRIDQPWLDRVRGAGVRLTSGCSASVVSPEGLVLTNHHCISQCVQTLSTADRDYLAAGFVAAGRAEEMRCAGTQAEILQTIADVTERVSRAAETRGGGDYVRARDAEVALIETEACAGREATHRCQVVTLYQGGQFKLHVFRKYEDVRLALAPEFKMAFFGGDPDNFTFPRFNLDFAFLRLYEGGRAAATPAHLTWSAGAPTAGEAVFVVGNPGSTSRLLTAEQLVTLRDHVLPIQQLQRSELRGRLIQFSAENPENARIATHDLFSLENSFKAVSGQVRALTVGGLIARKAEADQALMEKAAGRPGLGDPWHEIAAVQDDHAALFLRLDLIERRAGSGSALFAYARTLVRGAAERAKPNSRRLPEFTETRLALTERGLMEARPVHPALEQVYLEFWLAKVREYLSADAPETRALLGQDSPESLSRRLSRSSLADPAVRRALWDGGAAAVAASDDPMIRLVLAIDGAARSVRLAFETRVSGPTGQAAERIAKARFAVYGDEAYPDATFSPRLSYGAVEGWRHQGVTVAPFTQLGGLFERATGQPPYDLPQRWLDLKGRLDLTTPFNIASSNDVVGGNSGSPLVNARAEVVGAIFDGNIHSLGGSYGYDPALNRAVSVSTAAITEAMHKVYGADHLLAELGVR